MTEGTRLTWRGKVLLIVLSPLVAFGLLEIGLRIAGYRYEPWEARLEGKTFRELRQVDVYEPHPDLIWTLRRSTEIQVPHLGFAGTRSNSHGLRGKEIPGPRGPNELRVLCLGDSITFCLGLAEEETWPVRMEEALQASPAAQGKTVCVVNGAIPGYSSVQGMRVLDRLSSFEPDVIVFWFGLADSHEMRDLPDSMQTLPVEGLPRLLAAAWKFRVFQLVQRFVIALRRATAERTRVSRAEFRANVERLLDLERRGGPRVLFVKEPERCDVTIAQLEKVMARADQERVELVVAPRRLLTWIMPAPDVVDLRGRRATVDGRPALLFKPDDRFPGYATADAVMEVEQLRKDLAELIEHKRALDAILAGLPEDALDYEDLFGDAGPDEVFTDNCHLTPLGAVLAGRALARAALGELRAAGR